MDPKTASKRAESVKVVVRCRPLSSKEEEDGHKKVVAVDVARGSVLLYKHGVGTEDAPTREFTFDAVYDENSKQVDLYDETFCPIIDAVLQGYNGTIFAYGQTGTGKTYTMEGVRGDPELQGVIPSSFHHIFNHISRSHDEQYLIRASYLEIYQEEVRDLFSKNHKHRLELKERPDTGVYVKDLSSFVAKSVREIEHVMSVGNQNRAVGQTDMNEHSSRSHAIFIVTVECSAVREDGEDHIRMGKLNLVDLAGSERQSKTGSVGERFKEATKINLSLSTLGNVISALVDGKSTHIPYRDSRLTRLLQDSLGGNAKTVMVANIGPASYNYEETLTTLRYANRAKNIKNQPKINEDPKDALLREYQEEINRLKHALEKRRVGKIGGTHRKKKKPGENGEAISEEEYGDEEDTRGSKQGEKQGLEAKKTLLEEEKQAIMQNKGLLEEEREKLVAELQRRANEIKKEEEKRHRLEAKIKMMESKLLAGENTHCAILDQHEQQKQDLERQRQEMLKQKQLERQIKQELERQEESRQEIEGVYNSLQEEVTSKEKKLKKLQKRKTDAEIEIAEYREEQVRMREDLTLEIEEWRKKLKLRSLMVENFIPSEDVERVIGQAVFDEAEDIWKMKPVEPKPSGDSSDVLPRPMAIPGSLRPMCMYTRLAQQRGEDLLLLGENVIRLQLDMPTRTTQSYEGPLVAPTVQAVLEKALESEQDIVVDASTVQQLPFKKRTRKHQQTSSRSEKEVQPREREELPQPIDPREHFPTPRGLVTSRTRKHF